jgi:3-deoxy-manno-octulosonate cytidylyltransferase (CMP-KDO synthetase)
MIQGKPMIQWVWEAAAKCKAASRVVVATDDRRIQEVVRGFGGEVVMTKESHPSGTDRMAEVARKIKAKVYVNVQGDEPLMTPQVIETLIRGIGKSPMATLAHEIGSKAEFERPDVVKVIQNMKGDAIYFSRSPIPFLRKSGIRLWRHVGIYAFQAEALRQFVRWSPSPLELAESLEQLRAVENGMPIRVLETHFRCFGVDTPEDLTRVVRRLRTLAAKQG